MELWLTVLLTKSNLLSHLLQSLAVQLNDVFFCSEPTTSQDALLKKAVSLPASV